MEVIEKFERTIAKHCGSKYGVAVDCCTHAIFLSLIFLKEKGELKEGDEICVPSRTYRSVPLYVNHAGLKVVPVNVHWAGRYCLAPSRVWDSAVYFDKDIYVQDSFYCLSFQYRKTLPIGRGGMILTDDKDAVERLKEIVSEIRDLPAAVILERLFQASFLFGEGGPWEDDATAMIIKRASM